MHSTTNTTTTVCIVCECKLTDALEEIALVHSILRYAL